MNCDLCHLPFEGAPVVVIPHAERYHLHCVLLVLIRHLLSAATTGD